MSLAIIGALWLATAPAIAKNPYAPGQLKKRYGSVPGYPGASGYAPGHSKHRGAWGSFGYYRPIRNVPTPLEDSRAQNCICGAAECGLSLTGFSGLEKGRYDAGLDLIWRPRLFGVWSAAD